MMSTQDIKGNKHYFTLIIVYGIILGIIYSYWMIKEDLPMWASILVGVLFILGGVGCAFLSTAYESKKKAKAEALKISSEEEATATDSSNVEDNTLNEDTNLNTLDQEDNTNNN
ncbi:MAG: hypothetical protein K6G48_00630 [Acholeplasmatales bacterium]|nr:hypothetical protein [Acholeplasmatales bacterium]